MTVVRSTGTGYLLTSTRRTADGLVLHRAPGPAREHVLHLPADLAVRVSVLPVDGLRWSPGELAGDGQDHTVPGEASVAALVLAGMPVPAVARMVAPLGAGLAAVHGLSARAGVVPSGLRRLCRWLGTGAGPGHAAQLRALLLDGQPRLGSLLAAWIEEWRAGPRVLTLGAPGMNALYPDPGGTATTVLVTDELADGPPEWDLGWLLGELLELTDDPHRTSTSVALDRHPVAAALLAAYEGADRRVDRGRLARVAITRWVVHLHDYAAYVGWAGDLPDRLERVAALATDPGRVLDGA